MPGSKPSPVSKVAGLHTEFLTVLLRARRKWLSEAPNGWIKEVLGFRRFSFRGLAKVQAEWNLVCLALNIKRIGALRTA